MFYSFFMNKKEAYKFSDSVVAELTILRKQKKISRYKISKQTGISQSSIKYIEEFQQKPTLVILAMIADALGTSLDFIISKVNPQ